MFNMFVQLSNWKTVNMEQLYEQTLQTNRGELSLCMRVSENRAYFPVWLSQKHSNTIII